MQCSACVGLRLELETPDPLPVWDGFRCLLQVICGGWALPKGTQGYYSSQLWQCQCQSPTAALRSGCDASLYLFSLLAPAPPPPRRARGRRHLRTTWMKTGTPRPVASSSEPGAARWARVVEKKEKRTARKGRKKGAVLGVQRMRSGMSCRRALVTCHTKVSPVPALVLLDPFPVVVPSSPDGTSPAVQAVHLLRASVGIYHIGCMHDQPFFSFASRGFCI